MLEDLLRNLDNLEEGKEFAVPAPWKVIRPVVSAEEILKRARKAHTGERIHDYPIFQKSGDCPVIPFDIIKSKFERINQIVMRQYENIRYLNFKKDYIQIVTDPKYELLGEPILDYHPFSVSLSTTQVKVHDLYTDEKFSAERNPYVGTLDGITSVSPTISGDPVALSIGIMHDCSGLTSTIVKTKKAIIRDRVKKPDTNADLLVYYPVWQVPIAIKKEYVAVKTLEWESAWKRFHHEWNYKILSESSGALFYDSSYGNLFGEKLVDSYFLRKNRSSSIARYVADLGKTLEKNIFYERIVDGHVGGFGLVGGVFGGIFGLLLCQFASCSNQNLARSLDFGDFIRAGLLLGGLLGGIGMYLGYKMCDFNKDKLELKKHFEGIID